MKRASGLLRRGNGGHLIARTRGASADVRPFGRDGGREEHPIRASPYAAWQAWLRERKPPTLVVWGRNDPSFIAPGAEAFHRDLPEAEIHLLDAGHFALDEKNDEVAGLILAFLAKHSI